MARRQIGLYRGADALLPDYFSALNLAVVRKLEPCDVFIFMSGMFLEAAEFARREHGSKIWIERGSCHITTQQEILRDIPGAELPHRLVVDRELAGYALADRISVPSTHVAESFQADPSLYAKLIRNPYGVDLSAFPRCAPRPVGMLFRLVFAGTWSWRKGCDILTEAIKQVGDAQLVHVGSIGDLSFPADNARFLHVGPVDQLSLTRYYADADAFVLASREEGLSLVQAQALATGLPLICTDRTGGADLAHTPSLLGRIFVVPHGNPEALASAMLRVRDRLRGGPPFPPISDDDRQALSWRAYGRRYSDALLRNVPQQAAGTA
jgi:glycosyltransferase involved in cell wall biosynthesis